MEVVRRIYDGGLFDRAVAEVTSRARSRGSDVELAYQEAHTWTFRDGLVTRFEWSRDLPAALEAAGLSE